MQSIKKSRCGCWNGSAPERTFAANGQEAVKMASDLPYDLIFMDCQMPEMNGYDAPGDRRRTGPNQRSVIVALTA